MTYKLCKVLIGAGRMNTGMLDVYYAAGRLTADQYMELIGLMEEMQA